MVQNNMTPVASHYNLSQSHSVWEAFLRDEPSKEGAVRPEIAESWERCRRLGIDPLSLQKPEIISGEALEEIKKTKKILIDAAALFIEMLLDSLKGSEFIITIADNRGIILMSREYADSFTSNEIYLPGIQLCEEKFGTTAVGLVIKNKKPVQVVGAEHYKKDLHQWACFAAPIFGMDKDLLGIVGISGRCELADRYILAMIASAAKAVENEIAIRNINRTLVENNNQMATTLSAVSDGVVYVRNSRIVQINKTMSDFLGKPPRGVINKRVCDGIVAFPSIEEALKRTDMDNLVEIMITGAERNYDCLLNVQPTDDSEDSYVMIFTRTDEIQKLARRIHKYNAFFTFDDIKGKSFGIKEAIALAKKASDYNFKIIIEGESGTGKEMFAQAIHNNSTRKHKPFITFDCGAVPHDLFEGELFGYDKTDALMSRHEEKPGKFELANGGTLFLDDITNMPMEVQAKMLRILQEEKITRIGGTEQIPLDVRIIAASNTNLEREVKNGNFRSDLFYRLNVVFIRIPPLRERREDIAVLVDYFLNKNSRAGGVAVDKKAMNMLERYHWPGNVRELHNAVERAAMVCEGSKIKKEDFALNIMDVTGNDPGKFEMNSMNEQMKNYTLRVLEHTGGNISEAARILDVSRATIYSVLNRKGV